MNEVPRIAQIVGKMKAGGVEAMLMNYLRHVDTQRICFDFIVDEDSTIIPSQEILAKKGRIFKVPPYQKAGEYQRKLTTLLKEQQYSIVHSHLNALSIFPLHAAKNAGVPIRIAHSHSTSGKGEYAKNLMKGVLRPFSAAYPTHFCACSAHAGQWLFGKARMENGQIKLIKNAIDLPHFDFDQQIRDDMRRSLHLENKLVIGHVGRFMAQKNHGFLLDIFFNVLQQKPACVLLLAGEGELMESTRNKARQLGISQHVRFLGVRDDIADIMQAMDIFLLPSLYEGLGIVAIEAQTSGLMVVASDQVPMEAHVSDRMLRLPLSAPAELWAKHILTQSHYQRQSYLEDVRRQGYDITIAAKELEDYYMALLSNLPQRRRKA